jgi:hypothetical protein
MTLQEWITKTKEINPRCYAWQVDVSDTDCGIEVEYTVWYRVDGPCKDDYDLITAASCEQTLLALRNPRPDLDLEV